MDDHNTFASKDTLSEEGRTIAAVFHSQGEAESAHDALYTAGFTHTTLSRTSGSGDDDKGLWQSIKDFFTGDQEVTIYGEAVRRGKVLLTVQTTADRAAEAVDILDRYAPIDLDAHAQEWRNEGWSGETVGRHDLDRGNVRVRSRVRDLG